MADFKLSAAVLRWAIDRSGLSISDYSQPVGKWIAGEKSPTYRQLRTFADKAKVPFGYLYLKVPPNETLPAPDYRTRTDDEPNKTSVELRETLKHIKLRQDWVSSYLTEMGHEPLPFVGIHSKSSTATEVALSMCEFLELRESWTEEIANRDKAVLLLRSRIEKVGIFMVMNSLYGNSTRDRLDPSEFLGFALVDKIAPFIFINDSDYPNSKLFTIAHELAHIWIGESAISNQQVINRNERTSVEKFCDSIAAEFLAPKKRFRIAWNSTHDFSRLADNFCVSPITAARRAMDLGKIDRESFFEFYNKYKRDLENIPKQERTGGDFYLTQPKRIGKRFMKCVISAVGNGQLSYLDALKLTKLNSASFDKFAEKV